MRRALLRRRGNPMKLLARHLLSLAALLAPPVLAADHAWLSSPLRSNHPETYFTNLRDGDKIETPFVLKFGLSRYGLAPIAKKVPGAGHHHLLVNRALPLDFSKPLPFDDQYIHFGKGQMETVLTFKPGEYTLRLLLADDKHIPYFIYSKPMTITVTALNGAVDAKSLAPPGVAILEPRAGERLRPPFRVRLHASALNIGHVDIEDAAVGHFRLVLERAGAAPERIELTRGQTEVWLAPPDGSYKASVELLANAPGQSVTARSVPIELVVAR
jgi:hypothetical protein